MLNLRRPVTQTKSNIEKLKKELLDDKITRLTPRIIEYLENKVPLKFGKIFNDMSWDCMETRHELITLVNNKEISLKVAQLEIRRRGKIKNV